ncbi:MAG: hypothetical protein IKT78_04625, partial [Ruminiclostridium sp.]|nr:hypothetical protein [Ruminiclostridium sp.]
MINTIAVSVYVGVAVICGAIFAIYGYKKGWKGGLSILSVSLVSALCSFYAAPVVAGTVGDLSFVTDLADSACSAAEEIG